jgi:hypothetical protein
MYAVQMETPNCCHTPYIYWSRYFVRRCSRHCDMRRLVDRQTALVLTHLSTVLGDLKCVNVISVSFMLLSVTTQQRTDGQQIFGDLFGCWNYFSYATLSPDVGFGSPFLYLLIQWRFKNIVAYRPITKR